jgi:hypothetical protein
MFPKQPTWIKTRAEVYPDRINRIDRIRFLWSILKITMHAGDLRLKYDIPTIDPNIAAMCMVGNIKHILTYDRRNFEKKSK